MKLKLFCLCVVTAFGLAGCKEDVPELKTVDYWKANQQELRDYWRTQCRDKIEYTDDNCKVVERLSNGFDYGGEDRAREIYDSIMRERARGR